MSGIAAVIIEGLVGVAQSVISGVSQNKILEKGQEESRALNQEQMRESRLNRLATERANAMQYSLGKQQLEESTRLKEKELGMVQNQYAHDAFRNQVSNLTGLYKQSEELRDLMIHRIKGLRG